MLVDDEPTTLEVLQIILEEQGYSRFLPLEDSTLALETALRERPDVVLLDLMMPRMDGFEVLAAMRSHEELKHLPVVVLTSSVDGATKLRALELGATDFLSKPVDPSELALRLHNMLALKSYLDELAYTDSVTGLPNRRTFVERVDDVLRQRGEERWIGAVLHLKLDRVAQFKDAMGQHTTDRILRLLAERLDMVLSRLDGRAGPRAVGLSRVGTDEFAVLLTNSDNPEQAGVVAAGLITALGTPIVAGDSELITSGCVGIACIPDDGDSGAVLLQNATVATSYAGPHGRGVCQFFREDLNSEALRRLSLEQDLHRALERDELLLYYQPLVDAASGVIVGAEALLRWFHPTRGLIPPGQFIPIAEDSGLIVPIGEWVLAQACAQLARWRAAGAASLRVSVNVSSAQFLANDLLERVDEALSVSGIDARDLVIELTESLLMRQPERSAETLGLLRERGARVAVDDFGTGYSSLSYLKRFPLDELKIDRCFVSGVPADAGDASIVSAVIALSHGLGLEVVAEGVETTGQRDFLAACGCDQLQGFLYSRPVPAEDFGRMLALDCEQPVLVASGG